MAEEFRIPNLKESAQQVDLLNKEFKKTIGILLKVSQEGQKATSSFRGIGSIKGIQEFETASKKAVSGVTQAYGKLNSIEKARRDAMVEQERLSLRLLKTQKAQSLETEKLKIQIRELTKASKQEALEELGLVSAYDKVVRKMNEAGKVVQNLNAKRLTGEKLSRQEVNALKRSEKEFLKYNKAVIGADASIKRFQRNVGNYPAQLNAAAGAARNLASAMGLVGGAFLVVRTIKDAVNIMKDFEKQNATLSAILQVEKQDMKALSDEAVRLGSTTVKTAGEVTSLQIAYARLGFSQKEIIDLTEGTINGSIAMNAQLDSTANLTGAVINTFDELSTTDAPRILDIMSLATAKSALNFQKLETGIPIVAGAANAAKIPFTKLVALMGKLSDSGIDVSTSSTALRNIFIESAAQGLNYEQILDKIKGSTDKLTASNDEFGKRAAVSSTVLASNIDATKELDKSLQGAAGTAESMANKELDTLDGALKLLRSAWEGYVLEIGEAGEATNKIKESVQFLAKNLKNIISGLVIGTKLFSLYKLGVLLTNSALRAGGVINTLYTLSLTKMRGGIKATIQSLRAMKAATAASGVGLFLVLLGSAYELWVAFSDGAKEAADDLSSFNDEVERLKGLENRFAKSLENVAKGQERANAAIAEQFAIEDRLDKALKREGASFSLRKEFIAKITNLRHLDAEAAKKYADEEFSGYSELTRKKIASAIVLSTKLDSIINENLDFEKKATDKKIEESEKERLKRLKSRQKLSEFEINENINKLNRIIENEKNSNITIMKAIQDRVLLQMELESTVSDFRIKTNKLTGDELVLAEKELQSKLNNIIIKGQEELAKASTRKETEDTSLDKEDIGIDTKKHLIDSLIKAGQGTFDELSRLYDDDLDAFLKLAQAKLDITERYSESQKAAMQDVFSTFGQEYGVDTDKFLKLFDGKKNTTQDYVDAAGEALVGLSQLNSNNYEQDIEDERQKAESRLRFVEEGSAAERKIKEDLAERENQIRRKQVKQEKDQALFNIFINTARGVTAALTSTPPNVPLSVAVGAIGLASAVKVASREIPAFWMGTESTPAGEIMVNDDPHGIKGNNYKEVIKEPSGKLHFPQGKNVKMNVPKGSQVFPNYDMFNADLDNILNSSGIIPFSSQLEQQTPIISVNNTGATASEIDGVMGKYFSNLQVNQTIIDKNGIRTLISKGNSKTVIHNNRVSGKGFSV